ncbi:MAG TPA: hypothetical protein VN649_17410 [Ramlibacter sp.]|nr:hypothetical protein [Ramlibacter sp.]
MDDTTYARNRLNIALIDKAIFELGAQDSDILTKLGRLRDLGTTHQRVTPFRGFFIASYGYCIGELGDEYIGSYKICETRPESYWKAKTRLIGWCSYTEATSLAAMELAEATARQHILRSLSAPGPAQQASGAATEIFPPSYWESHRR